MLLIFDLDDTLIPTSGDITPKKLEEALRKMIESGLGITFDEGREALFSINEKASRSKDALREFALSINGTEEHVSIGEEVLKGDLKGISITKDCTINDFLAELKKKYKLAIVTGGEKKVQEEKIDLYQIDRSLFEEILVEEWGKKGKAYIQLKDRFGSFAVIGDRILNDLSDAKKLGGVTIHIRQGRGKLEPKNHPDVDFEIGTIKELKEVLREYDIK